MRGDNIHSTDFHDGGAIACCSFCGRYSDDSRSLSADTFPCDCGRSGGWCGSFKTPTEESKWSDLKPGDPIALCNEGIEIANRIGNKTLIRQFDKIKAKVLETRTNKAPRALQGAT